MLITAENAICIFEGSSTNVVILETILSALREHGTVVVEVKNNKQSVPTLAGCLFKNG